MSDANKYPELPKQLETGEAMDTAMAITEQANADDYFERLVERNMRYFRQSREEAEKVIRESLGYWAGYYSPGTRERVERLFRCAHPVLGPIATSPERTPEEILQMGFDMGRKARDQHERTG